MKAVFVELPAFARYRADYLGDEGFRGLQEAMMRNPEVGDVIEGTGGLRKLRHGDPRRGKGKRRFAGDLLLVGWRLAILAVYSVRQERNG